MSAGTTPFPRLDCTHKEADDRMMFHDCARHFKSVVGTHNHNIVIRQHGCICMPIIPFHSQLERSWPPRALARSQFRGEKVNTTDP